jgi:hypothetical protein
MQPVLSGRRVTDVAARAGPDIGPRTDIVSAFGKSTKFVEIHRTVACLKMPLEQVKIVNVRWLRAGHQERHRRRSIGKHRRHRFALAMGPLPMLETARIGGDAGSL